MEKGSILIWRTHRVEKEKEEIFGRRNVFFCGGEEKEKEKEENIWRRKISFLPRKEDDGEG